MYSWGIRLKVVDLLFVFLCLSCLMTMARTSLGPLKIVQDKGSSSHWGLIMMPGQEANSDNLGIFFLFSSE